MPENSTYSPTRLFGEISEKALQCAADYAETEFRSVYPKSIEDHVPGRDVDVEENLNITTSTT